MKNYQRLKGLIAASFTQMDAEGKVNLPVIGKYADLMAKSGMTGVFVCGTTGESLSLTVEERKNILEQWVKSADGRIDGFGETCLWIGSRCDCGNGTLFLQTGYG